MNETEIDLDEGEDESPTKGGHHGKEEHDHDKDHEEEAKIVEVNHSIYGWGRGYHG